MLITLVFTIACLAQTQATPQQDQNIVWSYETPQGFSLLEPGYRLPTQIKQALLEQVQPNPVYSKEYDEIFQDKAKLSAWLRNKLEQRETSLSKLIEAGKKVLDSDFAKSAPGHPIIRDTAKRQTKATAELSAIQRYLVVLRSWSPESFK